MFLVVIRLGEGLIDVYGAGCLNGVIEEDIFLRRNGCERHCAMIGAIEEDIFLRQNGCERRRTTIGAIEEDIFLRQNGGEGC